MPHSSGGGSHRSGSHSGRSSSSHRSSSHRSSYRSSSHRSSYGRDRYRSDRYSSSGSRSFGSDDVSYAKISKSPFPGARRYRYYHDGSYRYCYSTQDPSKSFRPSRLLLGIAYIPFLAVGGFMLLSSMRSIFAKPKTYDYDIVIKDEAGILDSFFDLDGTLEAFRDKTGVTPAVITVNNETWQNRFDSLESYAYNRYIAEFSDESHWLLVYSEPVTPDPEFNDWYWEGIQGDNTDSVITDAVADGMTNMVQTSLDAGYDLTDVLEKAFEEATDNIIVRKPTIFSLLPSMLPAMLMIAFVCFHAYFMLGLNELKYKNAELDPDAPENYPNLGTPFRETPSARMPAVSFNEPNGTQQSFGTPQQSFNSPYGAQQPYGTPQQSFNEPYGAQQSFNASYGAQPSAGGGQPYGRTGTEPEPEPEMPSLTELQEQPEPQPAAMPSVSPSVSPAVPPAVAPAPRESEKFGDLETDVCRWCGMRYVRGIQYCPGCGVSLAEFRRD